jgi:hypothetical protein
VSHRGGVHRGAGVPEELVGVGRVVGVVVAADVDARRVERHPVGVGRHRREPAGEVVARLDAAHPRRHERVGDDVVDLLRRLTLEVHRDGRREHHDVTDLFRAGVGQHCLL